jgi:hypothetical protein
MISTIRLISVLSLLAVLPACIAIPIGLGGEEPFSDEKIDFIEIGKTTKEEIAAAFEQPVQFQDGNIWLYVKAREEAEWAYVWLIPDNPEGTMGDVDFRYLVITFDDNGVVTDYETSSSEGSGCNRSGVCSIRGVDHMLVAPEEEGQMVKRVDLPPDRCAVYVYGKPLRAMRIELDDRQIGGLFDRNYFIYKQTAPGSHQLDGDYLSNGPIEFVCPEGTSVFLEVKKKWCGLLGDCGQPLVEVTQKDASEGRKAIARRGRIMTASDSME